MPARRVILLAEDDDNDIFLMRRALRRAGVTDELIVVRDGKEAVDYLGGQPPYTDRGAHPLPALLLLDLKMPLLDGFDVLTWLQTQAGLVEIPLVVLSSSDHEADRQRACRLGADDYRVKPQDFEELVKIAQELRARWLDGQASATE